MTVITALTALRTRLLTITPPADPGGTLQVYADPRDAISGGNFPCIFLALAPQVDHAWNIETLGQPGYGRHDYLAALYLSVALTSMPLNQRHARILPWPELIMRALAANVTLGGYVHHIGDETTGKLWTYRVQSTQWADGSYWGLRGLVPVTEKQSMDVGYTP
jgi:hypothetical protein